MPAARKAALETDQAVPGPWMSLLEAAAELGISRNGVLALAAVRELEVKQVAISSRQSRTLVSRSSVEEVKAKRAAGAER